MYKFGDRIQYPEYQKPSPEFISACRLLGEDLMTPYYTLDENKKIVRLEKPTEVVDTSDAFEKFSRLVGKDERWIDGVVEKMINEFGAIKTCRVLGQLIAAGNLLYQEYTNNGATNGNWKYYRSSFMTGL